MRFLPSSPVWAASTHSSNNTMYTLAKYYLFTSLTIFCSKYAEDVKDKPEDLVPWVAKLGDSLTKPAAEDDREEAERREQLKRFALRIWHLAILI